MRIISGKLKGRNLLAPDGKHTRPSSSRGRETVFNILSHAQWSPGLQDARVLDMFAGSGAMSMEAISRGAQFCLCLDTCPHARYTIAANSHSLGLQNKIRILPISALNPGQLPAISPFTLVFLDPPYDSQLAAPALQAVSDQGWLTQNAIAVIECQNSPKLPPVWQILLCRSTGKTQFVFAQLHV